MIIGNLSWNLTACFRYRALYNYRPQNEDELELCEGDTVYVMEKCDDGWYVGSSQRTGYFGTFPGNYVERIWRRHRLHWNKWIFPTSMNSKSKLYSKWKLMSYAHLKSQQDLLKSLKLTYRKLSARKIMKSYISLLTCKIIIYRFCSPKKRVFCIGEHISH